MSTAEFDIRLLLETLPDAVVACNEAGHVVFANAAVERLLGWRASELVGRSLEVVIPERLRGAHAQGFRRFLDTHQQRLMGRAVRLSALTKSGEEVEIELTLSNLQAGDEEIMIGALRDLRERVELERQTALAHSLKVTARIASQLGGLHRLEEILETVVGTLTTDLGAVRAELWLIDPADGLLRRRAESGAVGVEGSDVLDPATASGEVARAAREREVVVVSRALTRSGERVSVVALPLVSGGEARGVLTYESRQSLDLEELDALSAFSAVAAAAINDNLVLNREQAARLEAEDQRRRLQTILDTVSAGVLLAEGAEGRITVLNPAARRVLGFEPIPETFLELMERFPLERLDGRAIPLQERPLWRSVTDQEAASATVRYRRQDGRDLILDLNTAPYPGPEGGAVSTFSDVTERFRLEAELADRAAQFKALLDHLPVGVAYFDRFGICRASNGPARRFLGRSRKEITGSTADELFAKAPNLRAALLRCIHERTPHAEDGVRWEDESTRYLDWRFEPLPGSDPAKSRGALALIVDATESALARFALQRTVESAEMASRRKTQFLSAVSHDLRTPVNALSLQAELLARLIEIREDDDPEMTQLATDIRAVAANLIELINDLLDLTRFDSGMIDFHPTEFPLDEWLEKTLAPFEAAANEKGLDFTWRVDRSGRTVRADKVKLARVLVNLVSNSVKFSEKGRVDVTVRAAPDGGLILVVRDTGPGIPEDQLERVFDEFAQLRNPERDRTKGTGLGLAICRRLVEGVGGRLTVESRVGEGSTFSARYPPDHACASETSAAPLPRKEEAAPRADQSAVILIVEDDPNSRQALARLLTQAGYSVETARDGLEGLKVLERVKPSVVLLDLMMPGMEGGEVLRKIRKTPEWQDLKVVLLTGDVLSGRTSDLMALNVEGILAKPIDFGQLLDMVARLIQRGA